MPGGSSHAKLEIVCRSIKVLRKPEPATAEEVNGAALQFVRKISGFSKPSKANQEAFDRAVREITEASDRLLKTVGAASPSRTRSPEAAAPPPPAAPQE